MNLVREEFERRVRRGSPDECWLWTGVHNRKGYGLLNIGGENYTASRLALEFSGQARPSKRHLACHTCDNPACVNPAHLWWGLARENTQDAIKKGRIRKGSRHANARLTEDDVQALRLAFANGVNRPSLARRYGVSLRQIYYIATKERWAHV